MIIDEAQSMVAVLLRGELTAKATAEMIREIRFSAHYELELDGKGTIKIKHLWLFSQYPPPGEKSILEMYAEESG